ncbi:uncharacterized protein BP01DRAFT_358528 [Aspergillus saccharolyticus JOP 1030-1]|uniref:Uncharacterized protein n=1 Tax=Aspergillus saccharolyticus JOP 1030-1 TaxID=1450539 RepID=A0A318ZAS3_9EURO|nr:hypothetical protein BP01DRAFT_358528 [Aspergillus saccharolyticus JOP 1030-1]PYH43557.1 hypothetical protein BP01DRAFT_358528 [Aspergillus saccharolyticus JOP 1030-1]
MHHVVGMTMLYIYYVYIYAFGFVLVLFSFTCYASGTAIKRWWCITENARGWVNV